MKKKNFLGSKVLRYITMAVALLQELSAINNLVNVIPLLTAFTPNPVIAIDLMVISLFTLLCCIKFPKAWIDFNKKWFPFISTWRGRGIFLIFTGTLGFACDWISLIVGAVSVMLGITHLVMLCFIDMKFKKLKKRAQTIAPPPEDPVVESKV